MLPKNVNVIMERLYERFGRDEFVIKSLISKTRRIASPRKDQPHSIIEFATTIDNMVVTINNLGRYDYLDNTQLLEDIKSKLPPMMSMLWFNAVATMQHYTVEDLNNWLHQQSRALSRRVLPKEEKRRVVHNVFAANESSSSSTSTKQFVFVLQKTMCVLDELFSFRENDNRG